jgi:pSer/pThr/pTyr-binding forkhead associated (FHA) protein
MTAICPQCQAEYLPGTLVCSKCGYILSGSAVDSAPTIKMPTLSSPTPTTPLPKPPEPYPTTSIDTNTILLYVDQAEVPLVVSITDGSITLGRHSGLKTIQPMVDLSPYGAHLVGVSRFHASIQRNADRITVKDLGSANGTTLNGKRLQPNIEYPVNPNELILLAGLPIRVVFKDLSTIAPDRGSDS